MNCPCLGFTNFDLFVYFWIQCFFRCISLWLKTKFCCFDRFKLHNQFQPNQVKYICIYSKLVESFYSVNYSFKYILNYWSLMFTFFTRFFSLDQNQNGTKNANITKFKNPKNKVNIYDQQLNFWLNNWWLHKGQIISEWPYEIMVSPKIPTEKFPRFLP